jgi:hypothetical protein
LVDDLDGTLLDLGERDSVVEEVCASVARAHPGLDPGELLEARSTQIKRNGFLLAALSGLTVAALFLLPNDARAVAIKSKPVPTAECDQIIYSGALSSAIVHAPHDVVVGPVRLGDLNPRFVAKVLPGSRLLGIKSPLTVGPSKFPRLLVAAKGAKGPVSIAYGQPPSTTTTTVPLRTASERVVVQAPVSCGLPANGFVQYGGGFSLAQKQCVTLTVSIPGGRVLARRTVPFGSSVVCADTLK